MNENLSLPPTTNPAQILRYRDRQYAAEFLAAAIARFDFFTWLNNNAEATTESICDHFEWAPRPADVLLTLCRANGFIITDAEDRSTLTPITRADLARFTLDCLDNVECHGKVYHNKDDSLTWPPPSFGEGE